MAAPTAGAAVTQNPGAATHPHDHTAGAHRHDHPARQDGHRVLVGHAGADHRQEQAAGRLPADGQPRSCASPPAIRAPASRAAPPPQGGPLRVHQGAGPVAGQLVLAHQAPDGAAAGLHHRLQRQGVPVVDGLSGRVVDGPRISGRVRAAGQRLVHLGAAVPAVHRPVHPVATPADAAASRPARAARLLGLAGLLQPRRDRPVGPPGLPVHAVPAGAPDAAGVRQGRPARATAHGHPRAVAGGGDHLPGRVPSRPEPPELQRHRRRLLRGDRRRQADPRRGALRPLAQGQHVRRHLRPGQLLPVRPVPRDLRLERDLGQPPGRPCRGDLLRHADGRRAVLPRPPRARRAAGNAARLRLDGLSVHALRDELQHERQPRGGARRAGAAGHPLGSRAGGDGRPGRD